MGFVKKVWKDRKVEFPGRRRMAPVQGQDGVFDVMRAEGRVTEEGCPYNSQTMNDLEDRVAGGLENMQRQVTGHDREMLLAVQKAEREASYAETAAQKAQQLADGMWVQTVQRLCSPFDTRGPVVSCHPVKAYPLDVVSHIAPVQEGAGDPSPTNVRPIKGWSGVNLTQSGRNLAKLLPDTSTRNGVTRTLNPVTGEFTLKGTPTKAFSLALTSSMQMPGGATITNGVDNNFFKSMPEGTYLYLRDAVSDKEYASLDAHGDMAKTVTFPAGSGVTVDARLYIPTGKLIDVTFRYAMVQGSTAPTIYQPYQGKDYIQQFDQPVYGGEYDWDTGELTVTWGSVTLDGSDDELWELVEDVNFKTRIQYKNAKWPSWSGYANICQYGYPNNYIGRDGVAWIKKDTFGVQTVEKLKAFLAKNNVTYVYELETPYTVKLTPQPILSLDGTNTLYSDAGDTTVQGYTDPVWERQQLRDAIAALGQLPTV